MLGRLSSHVPDFENYYEPFLGGGALFFYLASRRGPFKAHLSDVNSDLINAYHMVKADIHELIERLRMHERNYSKNPSGFYYALRDARPNGKLERAARLLALNKTCYNGLYRVNSAGEFNVPMGNYKNPAICNELQLRAASTVLRRASASIRSCDYIDALARAERGDFVYLDPPFVPLSKTASFVSYTHAGFTPGDQQALARTYRSLDKKGCRVLLSNSDTPLTRRLYSGFEQFKVTASRAISCKGDGRTGCTELIVRNYTP